MRDNGFIVLVLIVAILYILSPIDFIPDPIPIFGWVDDAVVGLAAGALTMGAGKR